MSRQAQLVLLLEIMIAYLLVQLVRNFWSKLFNCRIGMHHTRKVIQRWGSESLLAWLVEVSVMSSLISWVVHGDDIGVLIWVLTWNLVMSIFKLDWPLKYCGQKGKLNPDYNIMWSQRKWRCRDAYSSGSTPKSIVSDFFGHIYFYNSWMHVNVRILFKSLYYSLFQPSIKIEPSSRNRVWHKHATANMDCGKNNPYYQEHPTFLSYYQHA